MISAFIVALSSFVMFYHPLFDLAIWLYDNYKSILPRFQWRILSKNVKPLTAGESRKGFGAVREHNQCNVVIIAQL